MKKYKAILVSNTHWDREHSRPFEQFRWHLVYNVMDKLLEIFASDSEYKFMLDGQSSPLDDYLQIRPEREAALKEHIKSGRLSVGPWLVGPDEFIPSGESLIRNLFFGHQLASRFGGVMKVGYNPDAFGHIAQLPQILRGFDIQSAVFSRGMGDGVGKPGVDFIWEAPDRSEVVATYHHYGNLAHLSSDPQAAGERLKKAVESMLPKNIPYFLLSNGSDGSPPQAHISHLIRQANDVLEDMAIVQGCLQDYTDLVYSERDKLQRYSGELRWGKYNLILGGVYSSRTYLKQANAKTQTLLEKYAEPLATFAWAGANDEYPLPFLNRAWKLLLENHFHDTICGCSRDEVYHDAMWRYAHSQQISEKLMERSFKVLRRQINTEPDPDVEAGLKPLPTANVISLVVFNPLSWTRTETVTKKIYAPIEADGRLPSYAVRDASGNLIASQIRNRRVCESFQPSFWDKRYPYGKRLCEFDLSFVAEEVPPCGYKVYYLCAESPSSEKSDLRVMSMGMENTHLWVDLNQNGSLNLTDKETGCCYEGLHYFEDVESVCGEYHHYTAPRSELISSLSEPARISLVESGPVCASFKIQLDLFLPESASQDFQGRSEKLISCPITTYVTLFAHSRRLEFRTIVENRAKDHRLRVRFPTGIVTDSVYAEGQFYVVERPIKLPPAEGWVEKPAPESPQQTFVDVSTNDRGLTLINEGLVEYAAELEGEEQRAKDGVVLSLTLLRSVGWIGREYFVTAVYKIPTPEAQCLGTHEFRYALLPHSGNWQTSKSWQAAHSFNAPLEAVESDLHQGELPKSLSFVSIQPSELVVSAIKKAEEGEAIVVRLYNVSSKGVRGKLRYFKSLRRVERVNFLEEPLETLQVEGDSLEFEVNRHQIVALKLY